jgi:LysM repeat protein
VPTKALPDEAEDDLDEPQDELDEPPVPDFLAGRPERPASQRPRTSQPEVPFKETVRREDLIPSWDLTGRYGAHVSERRGGRGGGADDDGGGGSRLSGTVTAVAVIAILALGVLGVIFLPGLLAGKGPAATPSPTLSTALPTSLLSPSLPLSSGTPLVTAVPSAGITPSPEASPRLYTVKSTDNSLTQIAHRFHITLRQLLDANPQITNPDRIQVGQVIVIPNPTPTPTPLST